MGTTSAISCWLVLLFFACSGAAYEQCTGGDRGLLPTETCQTGVYDCAYCIPENKKEPLKIDADTCSPYHSTHANPEGNTWIVVVGAIVGMTMAFGIGGNDSANSWGTSVGSGAISLRSACLMGGAAEFLGATLLGAGVSGTIQKGVADIADPQCWGCGFCDSRMSMYQFGMLAALCGTACFLLAVTLFGMPVSTTHAIVGGVVGMTWTAVGWSCLNWSMAMGLGAIVLSWVISPLFSGIVGSLMYIATYFAVLKTADPKKSAFITIPILYGMTTATMVFLILKKSAMTKKRMTDNTRAIIALCLLIIVPVIVHFAVMPKVRQAVEEYEEEEEKKGDGETSQSEEFQDGHETTDSNDDDGPGMQLCQGATPTRQLRVAKKAFQNLLVFNALVESFAHGANDTANATGPFGAIWNTYQNGLYACDGAGTPWYIMAVAGACVFVGVNAMGYRVIKTMGEEITEIDFHIGYCVEFASGFSVIVATFMGLPVSTTHCQVGAVVFVGALASGYRNVAWGMFGKIAVTWVATLPLAGGLSALLIFLRFARITD